LCFEEITVSLDELDLSVSIPAVVGVILGAAFISRFIRLADATAGLREYLSARSRLLGTLISCPHCLCFWLSLAGALVVANTWFQGAIITVLGWRVSYHLNRMMDRHGGRPDSDVRPTRQPRGERRCQQCGIPWRRGFLERRAHYFCSLSCWFGYLQDAQVAREQAEIVIFHADGRPVRRDLGPAPAPEVGTAAARALLESGQGYVYLDVRSVLEYENGHPAGAVNVPLYHHRSEGWVPNQTFLRAVAAHLTRDTRILIGCETGGRAALAASGLLAAGYTSVTPVRGGYSGVRDLLGRTVAPGWRQLGLPIEQGPAPEPPARTTPAIP
jgi:rhodanese-related sulfurtransferase